MSKKKSKTWDALTSEEKLESCRLLVKLVAAFPLYVEWLVASVKVVLAVRERDAAERKIREALQ